MAGVEVPLVWVGASHRELQNASAHRRMYTVMCMAWRTDAHQRPSAPIVA